MTAALRAGGGRRGGSGRWAPAVLLRLLGVMFAALMLLYVVRPLVLGVARRGAGAGGQWPAELAGPARAATAQLTQENVTLVQEHPERAAQLVREWLGETAPVPERVR